jgi:hypothetical protein
MVIRGLMVVLLVGIAGCGIQPGDEQGTWCREADADSIKVLFLDGVDTYSVLQRGAAGGVTTLADAEPYELVEEEGAWYWHSWLDGVEYGDEITALVPGDLLELEGSVSYTFLADHDPAFDVAGLEGCD